MVVWLKKADFINFELTFAGDMNFNAADVMYSQCRWDHDVWIIAKYRE